MRFIQISSISDQLLTWKNYGKGHYKPEINILLINLHDKGNMYISQILVIVPRVNFTRPEIMQTFFHTL